MSGVCEVLSKCILLTRTTRLQTNFNWERLPLLCVWALTLYRSSTNSLSSRIFTAIDCSPTQSSYLDQLTPLYCSLLKTTEFQGFCIVGSPPEKSLCPWIFRETKSVKHTGLSFQNKRTNSLFLQKARNWGWLIAWWSAISVGSSISNSHNQNWMLFVHPGTLELPQPGSERDNSPNKHYTICMTETWEDPFLGP